MQTLQLTKPVTEEAYNSVSNMLWMVAVKFSKKHGGEVDDLFSEANVAFCKAYPKWDPERGKLTTLMYHSVWRHLISYRKRQTKRQGYQFGQSEETNAESVVDDRSNFDLVEFIDNLSKDAQTVVKLLFNAPPQLRQEAEDKGGFAKNWSSSLRQLLKDIAWSPEKIKETFNEISEALQ